MFYYKKGPGYLYDDGASLLGGLLLFCLILYFAITFWFITLGLIFIVYLAFGFTHIPTGHKGIELAFGRKTQTVHEEGLAWHLPIFTTIRKVDCRQKFMDRIEMPVTLAYYISARIKMSVSFRISDLYNFLDNYSESDLGNKVSTYVMENLRKHLTTTSVTDSELREMDYDSYKEKQLKKINQGFLKNMGLEITDIVVVFVDLDEDMKQYFAILRKAEHLKAQSTMSHNEALEKALIMSGIVTQTNLNIMVNGLGQLRRLNSLT